MATGTNYYNLTKPASNENYNLATWNTNLDMIDAQMYQNETEVFGGATSLADGTVGNVPAPAIADKDKFLKGDGTWATPSGGGGGSSSVIPNPTGTPTDTLDTISIDGTIYEIQGSGGGGTYADVDLLWEYTDTFDITLAHPFTDYDFLVFEGYNYSDAYHVGGAIVSSTELENIIGSSSVRYTFIGAIGEFANYWVTSTTTISRSNEGNANVLKVWGIKLINSSSSSHTYSTTEHIVGTWIDGSDVYEQTIVLRENGTNNYTYIDSVFSQCLPANIDWIDIVSFYSKRNVGGYVDCMNNSSETNIVPNPSNQSIYYQTMHNASDVIVTIRYTKTGGNS